MICAAELPDEAGIQETAAAAGNFDAEEVATVAELWQEYKSKGGEASGYNFLVDREGTTVRGFACFGPRPLTQGAFDLYWIAVHPRARRKGVGEGLLRAVEVASAAQGGRLLLAETSGKPEYAPTRAFYLAAGYTPEATIRNFYAPGDDLVIFTLQLNRVELDHQSIRPKP